MPKEPYRDLSSTIPASRASAVTPSDSQVIEICRALYVGSGGDVAVVMADGGSITFAGVASGTILPIQVSKVLATGTNAASINALY